MTGSLEVDALVSSFNLVQQLLTYVGLTSTVAHGEYRWVDASGQGRVGVAFYGPEGDDIYRTRNSVAPRHPREPGEPIYKMIVSMLNIHRYFEVFEIGKPHFEHQGLLVLLWDYLADELPGVSSMDLPLGEN